MQKRERRLLQAEQAERKMKLDQAKGLRRVKEVQDPDQSDCSYHTQISADKDPYNSDSINEASDEKEDELNDIFNQNEV